MRKNSAGSAGMVSSTARPLRRSADGRLCGPVEDVIAWAFREELPKAPKIDRPMAMAGGYAATSRFMEYLSLVELHGVNQWGCVPDFSATSMPHPDAVEIGAAVRALDGVELEMPEGWNPAPELDGFGGLGAKAVSEAWRKMTSTQDGHTVLRLKPSDLVVCRAIMGADLDGMALDSVTMETERNGNGKDRWFVRRLVHTLTGRKLQDGTDETKPETIEVNGLDKRGYPLPGAYRRQYLDPDPVGAIIARAEHEIWLSALVIVHETVAGCLREIAMLPPAVPVRPWEAVAVRVLPDLVAEAAIREGERAAVREAFRCRFPRWFANLEKIAARGA